MFTEGNRICSPELLAQIAEVIDSAILITRFGSMGQFDHRIIYCNPAFSKLTGYQNKEIVGRSPDVICDPRTSGDKMLEFYSRCAQGGRFNVEMDSFQKQGGEIKLNVEVTPVIDETQGIHYYILMLKDVTAAKAQAPSLNSMFTQSIMQQQPAFQSPFMQQPMMQQPMMQQQQMQPQYGRPQTATQPMPTPMPAMAAQAPTPAPNVSQHNGYFEMPASMFQQIMMQPDPEPVVEETKAEDTSHFNERYWLSPNNDKTPHSFSSENPGPAHNNNLHGYFPKQFNDDAEHEVSVQEIIQQASMASKEPETQVKKAELSTDESIAEYCKTQFLANMSHDLRTPLNAIIGFSEVIKDQLFGPIENPRYVSYANDIFRSGQELFGTIAEIMELSEIAPDEKITDDERMNICDIIESVIDVLSPKAFEADVRIIKSFDARDLLLNGDRRKIKQAIAGVVGNSIKYSDAGSKIEVSARTNEKGDLKIAVHANTANILGKSALMGTITRKMESEYPEISLAKRFVEAHDGKFGIFNSATAGTEISMTLPATRLSMETEKKTLLKVIS